MSYKPRLLDYLDHIEEGLEVAMEALSDVDETHFVNEFAEVRQQAFAVRGAILQIGEAATQLHKRYPEFEQAHPEVEWPKITVMRNILAHEYFAADYQIIWNTVTDFMPVLMGQLPALREHAERLEPPSGQPAYRPR